MLVPAAPRSKPRTPASFSPLVSTIFPSGPERRTIRSRGLSRPSRAAGPRLAVGGKGHGEGRALVALEGSALVPAGRVPQLQVDPVIAAARGQDVTVGGKGQGKDLRPVPQEHEAFALAQAVEIPPGE